MKQTTIGPVNIRTLTAGCCQQSSNAKNGQINAITLVTRGYCNVITADYGISVASLTTNLIRAALPPAVEECLHFFSFACFAWGTAVQLFVLAWGTMNLPIDALRRMRRPDGPAPLHPRF